MDVDARAWWEAERSPLHRRWQLTSSPLPPTVYFRDHKSSTLFSYSVCLPLSSGQFVERGKHLCINTSSLDDDLGLVVNAVIAARWMNQLVQSLREIMIWSSTLKTYPWLMKSCCITRTAIMGQPQSFHKTKQITYCTQQTTTSTSCQNIETKTIWLSHESNQGQIILNQLLLIAWLENIRQKRERMSRWMGGQ